MIDASLSPLSHHMPIHHPLTRILESVKGKKKKKGNNYCIQFQQKKNETAFVFHFSQKEK